jgi:5'-methylthioadenosine phosphorylase
VSEPIGIIGGSGLYSLLAQADEIEVETPYGAPSDALVVADVGGRRLVFVPRHGRDHRFPPHRVPFRANLWALHSLGVRQVFASCAVGALDDSLSPGDLVIPDQVLDCTSGRPTTFYDDRVVHVPFADPYCPRGRTAVAAAATRADWPATVGGTMVVINGPRFGSRAESRSHAAAGASIVNMTGMPEAALARELALCYTTVALVTDRDAGTEPDETVTQADILAVFMASLDRLRTVLLDVATGLDDERNCQCPRALDATSVADR